MNISETGIALVKEFEGLRLTAYQDSVGVWTIGYGHTPASSSQAITSEQAEGLLMMDLQGTESCIRRLVTATITQNQFDALCSFVFNLGCNALAGSTLLSYVNREYFADAEQEFPKWSHAGGLVVPGLLRRRQAEAELFGGK